MQGLGHQILEENSGMHGLGCEFLVWRLQWFTLHVLAKNVKRLWTEHRLPLLRQWLRHADLVHWIACQYKLPPAVRATNVQHCDSATPQAHMHRERDAMNLRISAQTFVYSSRATRRVHCGLFQRLRPLLAGLVGLARRGTCCRRL